MSRKKNIVSSLFFLSSPSRIAPVFILTVSSDECVYLCVSKKKSPDNVCVTSQQMYHAGRS